MNEPIPTQADLVVIGAGSGGMTAALAGALHGMKVVLLEATQQVGGTSATSAGTIWVPCNTPSKEQGFPDSFEEAMQYLDGLVPSGQGRHLRETFLRTGPAIIDEIMRKSQVKFMAAGKHPDYVDIPGAKPAGRAMAPLPYDGRLLGEDFERVRPPMKSFMVLGGMMVGKADIGHLLNRFRSWASFRHATGMVLRYAKDRIGHSRGTRLVMGNALVARLFASLKDAGVPVVFGAVLDELLVENGSVNGARFKIDGKVAEIRARRGVVLAAGGVGHNERLRKQLMRPGHDKWPSLIFEGNRGGAVEAALKAGAAIEGEGRSGGVLYQPVSILDPAKGPSGGLFPHLFLDRAKPGLVAVDKAGKRFTNEGNSYHYFCEDMVRRNATTPCVPSWVVCDSEFVRKYGLGVVHPGTTDLRAHAQSGYLMVADTIEELARKIGVDPQGLARTIARNNDYATTGVDPEFGKGATEVSRFNGDPDHKPNPCLGPIAKAPFCAMALWPGDAAADAGLATDEDACVLDAAGRPIEGLYACGGDMASIMGGSYPGPGTTIGPAMVFAWRAAAHAASRSPDAESRTPDTSPRQAAMT